MKTLRTVLTVIVILIISAPVSAQVWGIRGGLNLAKVYEKVDGTNFSDLYKNTVGLHIGAAVDFPITDAFSIESGFIITTKGFKIKESFSFGFTSSEITTNTRLFFLDIPIMAKYKFGSVPIFLQAGPYFGIGLFGFTHAKVEVNGQTENDSETAEWGDNALQRLDYGLSVGAGFEANAFKFGLIYNYGLAKVFDSTADSYKSGHRVINITIGYWFL